MVRRLGLGKNNHLTYASLALNPRDCVVIKQIVFVIFSPIHILWVLIGIAPLY